MKIVLGGYYGAGNLGDELLLGLLIDRLKCAGHDVTVVTLDVQYTEKLHKCVAVERDDLPELFRLFTKSDAFILGGGGLFQDHHRFTVSDLDIFPAPGVSYYAQLCLMARQMGIPYILYAMGVGPVRTDDAKVITSQVFLDASYVSVRDRASANLLSQIGVTRKIDVVADPGWLIPLSGTVDLRLRYPILAGRRILVVVPRQWPFSEGWCRYLTDALAQIGPAGWAILWLPFQSSMHGDDLSIVEQLAGQLDSNTPQTIARPSDPDEAATIIASADGLVAMRLHAMIMGLRNGVPTLAIEYDDKLTAVSEAIDLADEMRLRLEDSPTRYLDGVAALIGKYPPIAQSDPSSIERLANSAQNGVQALLAAISKLTSRTDNQDWRDPKRHWMMQWIEKRVGQDANRIADLARQNARLIYQLEPFGPLARALEILRTDGAVALMRKLLRILAKRSIHPLFRKYALLRLRRILKAYPDRIPIVFPPIVAWNLHLFQRPHHLARELARHGYLYFFCIPVSSQERVLTFEEVEPGCFITPYFELLADLPGKIIHIYSTDNFHRLPWIRSRLVQGDHVLYEYVDEIHEDISGRHIPQYVWDKHNYLMRNEEVVCIATADKLYQEVRKMRSYNYALVTNGVDIAHFSVKRDECLVPPEMQDVISKGKPVIGYFGALAKWFDYDLLANLAVRRPGYAIVLIGPDYDGSLHGHHIWKLPNVSLIGAVDYKLLPRFACWFDVATIPFRINEITESTSPIKLFEYMALGLPIVTTDMPECRKYDSVLIGKNIDHFIEQVDYALQLTEALDYRQTLRREAEENSWPFKADEITRFLQLKTH